MDSAAFDALRDALTAPLVTLADHLNALVRYDRGENTSTNDGLSRKVVSARMNATLHTGAPPGGLEESRTVSRVASTAVLQGPERTLLTKVAHREERRSAHEARKVVRLEASILAAMRALLVELAAAAPRHFHPDVTTLSASVGDLLADRGGTPRPTVWLKFHQLPLTLSPALPARVADTLAPRVGLLADDAGPSAAPLPWTQFRVRGDAIHAPDARSAVELYMAFLDPGPLINLRDPNITDHARRRLQAMLPEASEVCT